MKQNRSKQVKSKLLDLILEPVNQNEQALTVFTPISEMPNSEPWIAIKEAYESDIFHVKVIACLMNGIASSKKQRFLLSRSFLLKYLNEDPNISPKDKPNDLSGQQQNKLMDTLLARMNRDNAFLVEIRPPSPKGDIVRRAGLYQANNKDFTETLDFWNDFA